MTVNCLATDYDGTISPSHVARTESDVSPETRKILCKIGKSIPIAVITTKDLGFVKSKTSFARAWSAIGGLETQIGSRILNRDLPTFPIPAISRAVNFARSHTTAHSVEIEEKQNCRGWTIAFCIDWRHAGNPDVARKNACQVADYSEALGLQVVRYEDQPFIDVYPVAPNKGRALRGILEELAIDDGVLYMGDSESDNSAFQNSNVGVGVIHSRTRSDDLESDFFVNFGDVSSFLENIVKNNFRFNPNFPNITLNPRPKRNSTKTLSQKSFLVPALRHESHS